MSHQPLPSMAGDLLACALLLLAMIAGPVFAGNWPQFRGPDSSGEATGEELPIEWGEGKNLAWKVEVPGVGWSQPIAWADRVFVTTAITDRQRKPRGGEFRPDLSAALFGGAPPDATYLWKVLCLDLATGKLVWERTACEGKPRTAKHRNNTYASETPVTDGERLVAYFGMTGLYCYALSGQLLWRRDLGAYPTYFGWGTGSSPTLGGDRIFVQCDNEEASFVAALDKLTGEEIWRVAREEKSNWSTPYLWKNKQRTELVVAGGGKMRSYHPESGQLLWELAGQGRTATTPLGNADLLYLDSYDRLTGILGRLVAVRAGATGDISLARGAVTNSWVAWSIPINAARVASPLLKAGCLYAVPQQSGIITCLDAETGALHYRERLPGAVGFTASPWTYQDKVFCLDEAGQTVVLAAGPKLQIVATNKLDGTFWASAAVAGEKLLLRSVDHLYCIAK